MAVLDTGQGRFVCDGTTVVELSGEIDIATADQVFADLVTAASEGCVVVDLSEVEFIDASGVNALVGAMRAAVRAHHHLALANPPAQLTRILDVLALHAVLPTHPDVDTALAAHRSMVPAPRRR
ncbi:STAS domain-containing protein [Nocardiopsis sp. YSL2]|uniref:STAS domain-containing protein n=1 Tax=Nocardiopsis sp. YSL2 TaxID=2939492 RepID=UPI0026F44C1C|nr:STAS domain-containing protein [Nocardiopsis sp. YSL2]